MYSRKQVERFIRDAWHFGSDDNGTEEHKGPDKFIRDKLPVKVVIEARVECLVHLEEGETENDLKERLVDIYLHGFDKDGEGRLNKEDRGVDFSTVTVVE